MFQRLVQGIAYTLIGMAMGQCFSFGYRILVARYLGPADFGIISAAVAMVTFCGAMGTLGIAVGVTRFVAFHGSSDQEPGIRNTVMNAWVMVTLAGLLLSIAIVVLAPQISRRLTHSETAVHILRIFAVSIPFITGTNIGLGVMRGMKTARLLAFGTDVLPNLGRLMGAAVVVTVGFGASGIAVSNVLVRILMLFVTAYLVVCSGFVKKFLRNTSSSLVQLVKTSLPLTFGVIGKVMRQQADILIVGVLGGPAMMGLYAVVVSFPRLLLFCQTATNRMLMPYVAELHGSNDISGVGDLFKVSAKWNLVFVLPPFAYLTYAGPELVGFLFGKDYVGAGQALRFLLPGVLINASTGSFGEMLQGMGKMKHFTYVMVFQTLSHIILITAFVPLWGLDGAAAGRGIALGLSAVLGCLILWQKTSLHPFSMEYGLIALIFLVTFIVGALITNWLGASNLTAKTISTVLSSVLFAACVLIWGTDQREKYYRGALLDKLKATQGRLFLI